MKITEIVQRGRVVVYVPQDSRTIYAWNSSLCCIEVYSRISSNVLDDTPGEDEWELITSKPFYGRDAFTFAKQMHIERMTIAISAA